MRTDRPKIKVPHEPLDIIVDMISASIVLFMIAYTAVSYGDLPEVTPSHFNAQGEVDGYSDKYMIWLLPVLGIATFVGLFILNRYPYLHNYMVNITEENALKNYKFSTRIVRFTNLFVIITFALINYSVITTAQGNDFSLGSWFIPMILVFSILLPVVVFMYYIKMNKQ